MAARIGAIVAAVAMVVIAVVVRNKIDENSVTVRLTCSTELSAACSRLGKGIKVTVEPAGTTFDRLVKLDPGADPGLDGWLVAGPWPRMVNAQRGVSSAGDLFGASSPPLATSPVVAVVEAQRAAAVKAKCQDPPKWACLAGVASGSWKDIGGSEAFGRVKAAVPDPLVDAEGTNVLAAMSASAFAGRPFNAGDDALRGVLRGLRSAQLKAGADAVSTLLTSGGAELDLVFTTEATAQSVLASAANRNVATVLYPAPVTTANVELGIPIGADAKGLQTSDLTKALTDAGWKAPSATTGAADPGVQAALRRAWDEQR
jgi:hypothetical protein